MISWDLTMKTWGFHWNNPGHIVGKIWENDDECIYPPEKNMLHRYGIDGPFSSMIGNDDFQLC